MASSALLALSPVSTGLLQRTDMKIIPSLATACLLPELGLCWPSLHSSEQLQTHLSTSKSQFCSSALLVLPPLRQCCGGHSFHYSHAGRSRLMMTPEPLRPDKGGVT
ncbi:hypothetical protein ILYODFUR_007897 [Ilyodon furcidens]|uniref:Uncharacterized protein n=1 Tax=Ilyodon furcidens TaxID=33524 RepID=A0ABV0U3K4_9TELE